MPETHAQPSGQWRAAVGEPDAIGRDRRNAEGRGVPARGERSRRAGPPALHRLVRGGRLHGPGRQDRQHLRAPARPRPEPAAGHDRQPSRHPADRRQVRRRLWRDGGARSRCAPSNDLGYETEAPIEIVAWTNEEGSRFSPAMVGSGVFAGVFDLAEGLARPDNVTGVTLGAELERIGFAGPEPVGGRPVAAYFEAHIEQGPILEAAGKPIGVVTGAQGQRWYEITVTGQEAHAGPTPMPRRRDALVGAARMIDAVNRIGYAHAPYACATVGFVQVSPNSRNTIPGRVFFTVDFRHPEDAVLTAMDRELRQACERRARRSASRSRSRNSGISRRRRSTPISSPRCAMLPRRRAIRIRTSSAAPATTPSTWRASRRAHGLRALRRRHQPQRDRGRQARGPDRRLQRAAQRGARPREYRFTDGRPGDEPLLRLRRPARDAGAQRTDCHTLRATQPCGSLPPTPPSSPVRCTWTRKRLEPGDRHGWVGASSRRRIHWRASSARPR